MAEDLKISAQTVALTNDRIADLEGRCQALMKSLALFISFGCPVCGGDCASANPPVMSCPMKIADEALGIHTRTLTR